MARRTGSVHSYTLFTGYFERRIRGEMQSYQVLGNPEPPRRTRALRGARDRPGL